MSKITLDNLSDNLKSYLESLGLSEEQVLNLINENGLDEEELKAMLKDTMSINELNTNSKTVIGAINELFQSANNGKELIANAIGEPVSAEDTFSAMSNDINGLLSTFKTNMMNNGVMVESSDKFKSLIDKIATMVEEGSGKGIQFASGTVSASSQISYVLLQGTNGHTSNSGYLVEITSLSFKPMIVLLANSNDTPVVSAYNNECFINFEDGYRKMEMATLTSSVANVTNLKLLDNGFRLATKKTGLYTYYAIGVGEEDTTLRDSLASILQEEGVSVTEEDTMANLISKVDSEFDKQVVPEGTAVASNVLSGKTFINSTGNTITGTMANNGTKTITPKASAQTLGAGYYDKITINGDADLVASNIVSGKSIFGVNGTAKTGGMQFATGTFDYVSSVSSITVTTNLDFTPQYIFVLIAGNTMSGDSGQTGKNIVVSNLAGVSFTGNNVYKYSIQNITSTSFKFNCVTRNAMQATITCNWYAFG